MPSTSIIGATLSENLSSEIFDPAGLKPTCWLKIIDIKAADIKPDQHVQL